MKLITLDSKPAFAQFRELGTTPRIPKFNLKIANFDSSPENEAISVSLSKSSTQAINDNLIQSETLNGLAALSSSLKGISSRLKDIEAKIVNLDPNAIEYAAYSAEKEGLKTELIQITSLTDEKGQRTQLGRIYDIINSGINSLAAGTSGEILARSLQSQQSILGDSLIRQFANGNLGSINMISGSLSSLSSFAFSGDYSGLDRALESISRGLSATGKLETKAPEIAVTKEEHKGTTPIELTEISYNSSSELALTLRTAAPDQLMRAASAGLDYDTRYALILKLKDDDEEKKQKTTIIPQSEERSLNIKNKEPLE